jgi:hypothetical protein
LKILNVVISEPHPSGHRTLLPVGPAYLNYLRLSFHHTYSFSSLDKHIIAERERVAKLHADDASGEDDLGVGDEEETEELLSLDPKEWKVYTEQYQLSLYPYVYFQKQDHYAVLGLSHLRYKAIPEQIKIARKSFGALPSSKP